MFYLETRLLSITWVQTSWNLLVTVQRSVLLFGKYLVNDISSVVDNNSQHLYNDIVNDKKFP